MSTNNTDDQGVVFRKSHGQYLVHANGRGIACALSSRLYKQITAPAPDPLAIGDVVRFSQAGDGPAVITGILPRRNKFSRQAVTPGRQVSEQVIVSNVDQVVPVFAAASPTPKWALLDRYLVSAEAAGLPVLIIITKSDLSRTGDGLAETLQEYRRVGYPLHCVSAVTGEGLDELARLLLGRTSVLVGKSGVGKTSLLNALQPGLGRRVREVGSGKQGKGRHATTALEMLPLDRGGAVVDTPGIREFGLWDVDPDDLALYFPEMRALVGSCKFGLDCRHDEEPGCSIRQAVMAGQVSPYRYRSYLKLRGTS